MIDYTVKNAKAKKPFTGNMYGQGDKNSAFIKQPAYDKDLKPLVKPNPNVR